MSESPNAENENCPASVFEEICKFGGSIKVLPPFDFTKNILKENRYRKLENISIILAVALANLLILRGVWIWDQSSHLYYFSRISICCTVTAALEPLFGSMINRCVWKEFFTEFASLNREIDWRLSSIEAHFYRNIKTYFGIFLIINLSVPCHIYLISRMNSAEPYIHVIILMGTMTVLLYLNSYKFAIFVFLHDIKIKYNNLNSKVLMLKSEDNRQVVLNTIDDVELKTLRICNITRLIKKLLGYQLFLMILSAFFTGVECCLFTYNYPKVLLAPLYFIFLIPIFVCIYACDIAHKAAMKLTSNLLAASNLFRDDPEIFEKLKDVSYTIGLLHSDFTAARFLKVNRQIAISLLSAVASYFLVIQQMYLPNEECSGNYTNRSM